MWSAASFIHGVKPLPQKDFQDLCSGDHNLALTYHLHRVSEISLV